MPEAVHAPPDLRTRPRIRDTRGWCAALRPAGRASAFVAIHDLCSGGMGVERCPPLRSDEVVRFEFWGSDFAWSGAARVVHAEHSRAGLEFLRWDGPVHRPLGRLLSSRMQ